MKDFAEKTMFFTWFLFSGFLVLVSDEIFELHDERQQFTQISSVLSLLARWLENQVKTFFSENINISIKLD